MQSTMETSAGIYRTESSLAARAKTLRQLQERSDNLALDDHSLTFNTDLVAALELSFMLDVAESMVQSALQRTESRGAHQRTDFPKRNDEKFLAHSLVFRAADGRPRVENLHVRITRCPPADRVSGHPSQKAARSWATRAATT